MNTPHRYSTTYLSILLQVDIGIISSLGLLQIMLYKHSQCVFYVCTCGIDIKESTDTAKQLSKMVVPISYAVSAVYESLLFQILAQHLCSGLLILVILVRMWFNLHFLTNNEAEHFFIVY